MVLVCQEFHFEQYSFYSKTSVYMHQKLSLISFRVRETIIGLTFLCSGSFTHTQMNPAEQVVTKSSSLEVAMLKLRIQCTSSRPATRKKIRETPNS